MGELTKASASLTATNTELYASVASLIEGNEQLSCRFVNCRNNRNRGESPVPCTEKMCPHFKLDFMHVPDDCFELDKTILDALGVGEDVFGNEGPLL